MLLTTAQTPLLGAFYCSYLTFKMACCAVNCTNSFSKVMLILFRGIGEIMAFCLYVSPD